MIPIEYFWIALIAVFGAIGAARGLVKELGATAILSLSLFTLFLGWDKLGSHIFEAVHSRAGGAQTSTVEAAYFSIAVLLVAFISYEGFVLSFPVKEMKGLFKGVLGFAGGLLNGYLVVGTVWDAVAHAGYLAPKLTVVVHDFTALHNRLIEYLPITLMDKSSPLIALVLGMILLLAIIFK